MAVGGIACRGRGGQGCLASCPSYTPGCSETWICALCPWDKSEIQMHTSGPFESWVVATTTMRNVWIHPLDGAVDPGLLECEAHDNLPTQPHTGNPLKSICAALIHHIFTLCPHNLHKQIYAMNAFTWAGGDCIGLLSRMMCCSCLSFL